MALRRPSSPLLDTREATDIEKLLQWAIGCELADVIVEAADGPSAYTGGVSADGCFAVERYGRLGTFIDCTGTAPIRSDQPLHPDAETVYRIAKDVLDAPTLVLVRDCARQKTRPDWQPFKVIEWVPEMKDTSRGRAVRVRTLPSGAQYCKVEVRDRGYELAAWREIYIWWRDALVKLEHAIMAEEHRLTRWRLKFWREPREPWRTKNR